MHHSHLPSNSWVTTNWVDIINYIVHSRVPNRIVLHYGIRFSHSPSTFVLSCSIRAECLANETAQPVGGYLVDFAAVLELKDDSLGVC